jgi:hypothetical protein
MNERSIHTFTFKDPDSQKGLQFVTQSGQLLFVDAFVGAGQGSIVWDSKVHKRDRRLEVLLEAAKLWSEERFENMNKMFDVGVDQ